MSEETSIDPRALARRWERAEAERPVLVRLARRRGLSDQDAEDCVQEAVLRVVPRPDLDERRMGALLTTVVVRLAIDHHRRSKTAAGAVERAAGDVRRVEGDPACVVCDRDEARWTAGLVERLPSAQRAVLWARADGRPVNDIARDMSTSPKAVESLIARARAAARSAMASGLSVAYALARRLSAFSFDAAVPAVAAAVVAILAAPVLRTPAARAATSAPARPGLRAAAASAAVHGADPARAAVRPSRTSGDGPGRRQPPSGAGRQGGGGDGITPVAQVPVGGGGVTVGHRPSNETEEEKVLDCVHYGPTLGWHHDNTWPFPDDGHACRTEPGSVLWR